MLKPLLKSPESGAAFLSEPEGTQAKGAKTQAKGNGPLVWMEKASLTTEGHSDYEATREAGTLYVVRSVGD